MSTLATALSLIASYLGGRPPRADGPRSAVRYPLTSSGLPADDYATAAAVQPQLPLSRGGWRGFWTVAALAATAAGVSLAAISPVLFIAWVMVDTGVVQVASLVFRPRVAELLLNTVLLVVLTVPLSAVLAVALAWLTERSDMPAARNVSRLLVAPLAIPAFVHSYAWVSIAPGMNGLFAAVLVSTLAYFPFMYLPIAAAVRRLDPALEHAASSLGHCPRRVFLRVTLPQLRLAVVGGAQLVGLHLLAEYGLFAMLRFDTFTTAIVDQFQSSYSGPAANALGIVLVVCAMGLLVLEDRLRGEQRYARVGPGAARPARRWPLGRLRYPALAMVLLVVVLSVGVPLVTLGRWLAAGGWVIWTLGEFSTTLMQTLSLAVLGGLVTTVLAIPVSWMCVRQQGRFVRLLEASNYVVGSLPGVIVALALVFFTVRVAMPLYQTTATLIAAYVILFLPRAIVSLRASIAQVPVNLEEAAVNLGRPPARAILGITLRLAAPGAAAGAALVAIGITNELTATLLLAPNGTQTLATAFWAHTSELDYAAAAPYALMMVLLSLPMATVLHTLSTHRSNKS